MVVVDVLVDVDDLGDDLDGVAAVLLVLLEVDEDCDREEEFDNTPRRLLLLRMPRMLCDSAR